MKIGIVDCGGGNLHSVKNALDYLGVDSVLTHDPHDIHLVDKIIFPGQGHFGTVMQQLIQKNLDKAIRECIFSKPFLGICVGMQILFESSEEAPEISGLGIVKGKVKKFPASQKIPQMGWNEVSWEKPSHFYFANSYYCEPEDPSWIVATSHYGIKFPCIIQREHLTAVQFHPEKSGEAGLIFLNNFMEKS
jgi:imidazole glycerol phosphate synthase glutamine amidotransferase subunit